MSEFVTSYDFTSDYAVLAVLALAAIVGGLLTIDVVMAVRRWRKARRHHD